MEKPSAPFLPHRAPSNKLQWRAVSYPFNFGIQPVTVYNITVTTDPKLKLGTAQTLCGGAILQVTNPHQAKIAEQASASAAADEDILAVVSQSELLQPPSPPVIQDPPLTQKIQDGRIDKNNRITATRTVDSTMNSDRSLAAAATTVGIHLKECCLLSPITSHLWPLCISVLALSRCRPAPVAISVLDNVHCNSLFLLSPKTPPLGALMITPSHAMLVLKVSSTCPSPTEPKMAYKKVLSGSG